MWAAGRQIGEAGKGARSREEMQRLHRDVVLEDRIKEEDEGRTVWAHFKHP